MKSLDYATVGDCGHDPMMMVINHGGRGRWRGLRFDIY